MEISRRDFLRLSGLGIGTAAAISLIPSHLVTAAAGDSPLQNNGDETINAVLYDAVKCTGCKECELACNEHNNLPGNTAYTKINIAEFEVDGSPGEVFSKHQCMHCLEPACAEVCIVGALQKTPEGPVVYNGDKCIGCRYCMVACPFNVPTFEWDKPMPLIHKCNFCNDLLATGAEPACVKACPANALEFGERGELIARAKERIASAPDKYTDHIYGEYENGGTSWLYLSPIPFEELDFPAVSPEPVVADVRHAMSAVLPTLGTVAVAMTGIYCLTQRRNKTKAQDKGKEE
jgi:Fe-S-cluster-containing dehydrogenase component